MKTALYPGSFDPVTNGHLDIIERSSKMFDKVVVAIGENINKSCLFSLEERKDMLTQAVNHLNNVEVQSFKGLAIDFAKEINSNIIIRGLRAVSDFDYEFQMALTNRKINPEIETIFIMTQEKFIFLSASNVKELASYNADVKDLVPELVQTKLKEKFKGSN